MTMFSKTVTPPTLNLSFSDEKQPTYAKILLKGYPKGGKTTSALEIASLMSGDQKFPVIVTEKNGFDMYRHRFPLARPIYLDEESTGYNGSTYVQAIQLAMIINPIVMVVDSISPAWSGKQGVLDQAAATGKSDFYVWKGPKEHNKRLIEEMLRVPCHVIATVRSKTKLIVNADTKEVTKKAGAPIQWGEIEFEFDVNADLSKGGNIVITGSRLETLKAGDAFPKTDDLVRGFHKNNIELFNKIGEGLTIING